MVCEFGGAGFIPYLYQIKFRVPDKKGVGYLPPPGVVTRVAIVLVYEVGIYVK